VYYSTMRAFITFVSCLALAACSTPDWIGGPLVTPGKYRPQDCKALAATQKAQTAEVLKFEQLDERARRETGGVLVSGIAYGTSTLKARAELAEVQAEIRARRCPPAGA
jgi:hypothetical protein